MSRFKLILILAVVLIAAAMQWQGVRTRAREADLGQELASLEKQEIRRHTTHSTESAAAPRKMRSPRPQGKTLQSKNPDVGRSLSPDVLMTRAIENGDLAEATRNCCLIGKDYLERSALNQLMEAVTTREDQRLVLEQAGKSADQPIFFMLARALADKSTFEANLDLLSRAELTPEKHDLAAAAIACAKIDDDTPACAAWLLNTLQTEQTEPITHFATSWTEGDFRAANTWVNSLPQGRPRDAAVAGFAPVAARLDGASAVDWALTINDPAQRQSTLDAVSRTWKTREPAAAAAYLRDNGIEAD